MIMDNKKLTPAEKKAIKQANLLESMKGIMVNTPDGKQSMYDLCEGVGVASRTRYFNIVEKLAPKDKRTMEEPFIKANVTTDRGIVFCNGFEIKGVDANVWKMYSNSPVVEVMARL